MNILILGKTKSGKTTISKKISEKFNFEIHSMSEMFRSLEKDNDKLTNNSKTLLINDWDCNIKYIENKFGKKIDNINNVIFEGFRNPYEFHKFFNNNTIVIYLKPNFIEYKDDFEKKGLKSIYKSLKWYLNNLKSKNIYFIDYKNYEELNQIFEITINSIFEQTN